LSAHKIVVTGAGGFIGGHLVQRLLGEGHAQIAAVDIKPRKNGSRSTRGSKTSRPTCRISMPAGA